jgi:hypothetical protein
MYWITEQCTAFIWLRKQPSLPGSSTIISINSLLFCPTTFGASLTNCPDRYKLHLIQWATVVVIIATVWAITAVHIQSWNLT